MVNPFLGTKAQGVGREEEVIRYSGQPGRSQFASTSKVTTSSFAE
jgi:hypothetical protein